MIPLIAMAAIAAATAIASWMSSEAGRKASAAERKKMQEMVEKLQTPNFDMSTINPEEYKVVRKYVPKAADFVAEQNPKLIKADSADAKLGRDTARQVLERYRSIVANNGNDEAQSILQQRAMDSASAQNRGMQGQIEEQMQSRGQQNAGNTLAMRLSAMQNANQSAAVSSQNAAMGAYQNKLDALRASAQLGSQIRNEDVALEGRNNDIWNSFNARTASRKQAWAESTANTYNDSEKFNIGNEQRVSDANVSGRNDSARWNQENQNRLKQADFSNQANKTSLMTGQGTGKIADINNSTIDRNNAIQGVGNVAQAGVGYYYGKQNTERPATNQYLSYDDDEDERDYGGYGHPNKKNKKQF